MYDGNMKTSDGSPTAIRDSLAFSRTKMANERTFLAYIRTAMTFMIAGAGILQFIQGGYYILISGWLLIVMGIFIFCWGHMNYKKFKKILV